MNKPLAHLVNASAALQNITTAIPLTARSSGAVAVILVHGPAALTNVLAIADAGRKLNPCAAAGHVIRTDFYCDGEIFDNGLIVSHSPMQIELHLHGGQAVVDTALAALRGQGTVIAGQTDATAPDIWRTGSLIRGEILQALCHADSDAAVDMLAGQLDHGLEMWAGQARQQLFAATTEQEAIWRLNADSQWIREQNNWWRFLLKPAVVVIFGAPNAGKSTLLNALAGRPSSVISDTPGTTRDWVEETVIFSCGEMRFCVTLVDTAGIRPTHDPLEAASIERTEIQLNRADVILYLRDQSYDAGREERQHQQRLNAMRRAGKRVITASTKCDLPRCRPVDQEFQSRHAAAISAITMTGLPELMAAVHDTLGLKQFTGTFRTPLCCNSRQQSLLAELAVAPTRTDAAATLDALTGQ